MAKQQPVPSSRHNSIFKARPGEVVVAQDTKRGCGYCDQLSKKNQEKSRRGTHATGMAQIHRGVFLLLYWGLVYVFVLVGRKKW